MIAILATDYSCVMLYKGPLFAIVKFVMSDIGNYNIFVSLDSNSLVFLSIKPTTHNAYA
jgi:hypothetical protein